MYVVAHLLRGNVDQEQPSVVGRVVQPLVGGRSWAVGDLCQDPVQFHRAFLVCLVDGSQVLYLQQGKGLVERPRDPLGDRAVDARLR